MTHPPEKAYELSLRVEGEDGRTNWYAAGNIYQAPPAPSIRVTEALKKVVAKAPVGSFINFSARLRRASRDNSDRGRGE